MSKIFITGMTAQQSSPNANSRSLSFAGVLNKVLSESGNSVTWSDPSVHMTKKELDKFDVVLVGIAPVTSVSVNRIYGALHLVSTLYGSNKLRFFIDSPNSSQVEVSIKSVISNPDNLTKSFFSYRKEYADVIINPEILESVKNGLAVLYNDVWPTTIYPALPWKTTDTVKLPSNAKKNLSPVNLDSHLISENDFETDRRDKWVVDDYSTKWVKSTIETLTLPNSPMKWNKGWNDDQVFEQISRSIGVIISPDKKDGTWWSYRYVQALTSGTPVVTDWKESHVLSDAWGVLASSIDTMSQQKRDLVALAQRESYFSKIENKEKSLETLESLLGIRSK